MAGCRLSQGTPANISLGADCDSWYKNESGKVTNNWPDFTYVYEEATQSIDPDDYAFTQLNRSDMTEAAE